MGRPVWEPITLFAIVIFVVTGCSSGYSAPDKFTASNGAVTQATKGALSTGASPGLDGAPQISCRADRTFCSIDYVIKESTGISTDHELIEPTRQLWKALFADSKFQRGRITVSGPTTTAGGKDQTSKLFTLTCDRGAAEQIDWDNVTGKGVRKLCEFAANIGGL